MPFQASAIANAFLDLAEAAREPLTPMKLQKLVYFAHGWHLGLTGNPLLDEVVQAWSYGPVVKSLYGKFAEYGADTIDQKITLWRSFGSPFQFVNKTPSIKDADEPELNRVTAKSVVKRVWDTYGPFTAVQLSNLTHAPGTPWDRVKKKYEEEGRPIPKYATIPDEWIEEYFKAKAKE